MSTTGCGLAHNTTGTCWLQWLGGARQADNALGENRDLALTSPPLLGDRDALRERDAPRETDALRKHAYLVYSEGLVTTNRPREERGVISILRSYRASPY